MLKARQLIQSPISLQECLVPAALAEQPAAASSGDSREVVALGRRPPQAITASKIEWSGDSYWRQWRETSGIIISHALDGQSDGMASWHSGMAAASHFNRWEVAKSSGQCHELSSHDCGQASTQQSRCFPQTASYLKAHGVPGSFLRHGAC